MLADDLLNPEAIDELTNDQVQESVVDVAFTMDLFQLQALLESYALSLEQVQETAVVFAEKALAFIQMRDVVTAQVHAGRLQEALAVWQSDADKMREIAKTAVTYLQDELALRPDLALTGFKGAWPGERHIINDVILDEVPDIVSEILAYDRKREKSQQDQNRLSAQIIKLESEIAIWHPEKVTTTNAVPDEHELTDTFTLTEIMGMLFEAQATVSRLEGRLTQLRSISLNAIRRGAGRLLELGEDEETILIDGLTLAAIHTNQHEAYPNDRLILLEQQIQSKINQYSIERKSTETIRSAQLLRDKWRDDVLVDLLTALAEEQDDIKAILLMLTANNVHPRSVNIPLPGSTVLSLLRGIGQLSQKAAPFDLLNLLSSSFLSGWETDDKATQFELCLVFTAAYFCGRYELPEGILWQLPGEWPVAGMPNWNVLWQSLLLGEEPVTIIMRRDTELENQNKLNLARRKAQEVLAQQDARYVKINPIKSDRHRHMLGNYLLPRLKVHYDRLNHLEARWQTAEAYQKPGLLRELRTWIANELAKGLSESGMTDLYEAGVHEHDIYDNHPFFRRSSLSLAINSGQAVGEYAQALTTVWEESIQDVTQVSKEDLAEELERVRPNTSLGQIALEEIVQRQGRAVLSREADVILRQSRDTLTQELMLKPAYALSLPRLIGFLTENPFGWPQLLPSLLEDIAEPVLAEEAARLLLQAQAPWHALLLTRYVDLEIQKQAQQMQQEMHKEIDELETAVLRLGGRVPTELQRAKEYGRYRLVLDLLQVQLEALQVQRAEHARTLQEQARSLRQKINDLDNALFEIQSEIPREVYAEIEKGFQASRQAVREPVNFEAISEYIEAIKFRINYRSWPIADIHDTTSRLLQKFAAEESPEEVRLTVSQALELFKKYDLRRLGLDPEYVASSQVDTRIRIFEDWLVLKKIISFQTSSMNASQIQHIQHFYRYFSRMVALKQLLNPQGQPLQFIDPTVYQHMALKYPRAKILKDRRLILIVLPGNPPSSDDTRLLERKILELPWLETGSDYAFVVLFIPNCTEDIKKRLQKNFSNKGLVIIDESALLEICLGLKASQNAIGRLRPMLLNSLNIGDISIFQVNQACHPDTSVFVGRQNLLTRIANSHDNYAIYGGRRIGKTSVIHAIQERLEAQGVTVVLYSFEGSDASDEGTARNLANYLRLGDSVASVDDFNLDLQKKLDENPDLRIVLLLDEVDRYIVANPSRHKIIESMRKLSDQNGGRFRVVIAGFMEFFHCLRGLGPYSSSSDPWRRMMNDDGPLGNLRAEDAEGIVREGFLNVLGWEFEHPMIPERIVLRTGGHPAFVQYFCKKIQELVGKRNGRIIRLEDIETVFADAHPTYSFIAHVRKTLELNLGVIERFLIVWLAALSSEATTFTLDAINEIFESTGVQVPPTHLHRALEQLEVTSVVKVKAEGLFEFSVPDYPNILYRLGDTTHLDELEQKLKEHLVKIKFEEA